MKYVPFVALPLLFVLSVWTSVLADAGASSEDEAAAKRGEKLFHDTQELMFPSCAHCHNLVPPEKEAKEAEHLGPGVTLWGAAVREGWRNMNTYADVGEALQKCAKEFQGRKGGFKAAQRKDLVAFLKTKGPEEGTLPKRKVQRKPRLLDDYDGGDAAKGKKLFERHCTGCHNPGENAISFELKPGKKKKAVIARSVRGYNPKRKFDPKSMSYFTNDRLPDEDLRHILAYLGR
jgi:mono/diheme cytochrome c family protein